MVDSELHDDIAGSLLLSAAFERERSELQSAFEMGFVSSETHSAVMEFLRSKYVQKHQNEKGVRKKALTRKARSNRLRTRPR